MICYVYMHYGVPENRMHLLMNIHKPNRVIYDVNK